MIKAIIFDYGGVFTFRSNFRDYCEENKERLGIDPAELHKVIRENWMKSRVNDMDSMLFWKNIAEHAKIDSDKLRKELLDFFGFNYDLLEFVKKLKDKYKLGMLSNQIEDWLEEVIENHHFNDIFEVIVTSYGSKKAKPDIEIFKEIVEKMSVKPEECVYIDDMEKNVAPAEKLGMKMLLFKDFEQMKKELTDFGVSW